jgi:hypothetical protein
LRPGETGTLLGRPNFDMSLKTRIYIGLVLALGAATLGYGVVNWKAPDFVRFLVYLVLVIVSAPLKVTLPGVTGTMSMNFVIVLAGLVDFSLPEIIVMSGVSATAQCILHSRLRPRFLHILFSAASVQITSAATYSVYHLIPLHSMPLRLLGAATVFFVANTIFIAIVIALTEGKPIGRVWRSCYLWCFPYYLAGASIAGMFTSLNRAFGWQTGILIVPVIYLIYRFHRQYLEQQQNKRQHAEEERRYAGEIAVMKAKTAQVVAAAMSVNAKLFRAPYQSGRPRYLLSRDREGAGLKCR